MMMWSDGRYRDYGADHIDDGECLARQGNEQRDGNAG
jgi:hypothetical protein